MELVIIFIVLILLGLIILRAKKKPSKDDITKFNDITYLPIRIMTKTEIKFFNILQLALPQYHIFSQVSTNAILKVTSNNTSHYWKVRNKYDPTCIDFVICDQNFNIAAIIELDDKTHDNKKGKDAIRDYMTAKAGYKTMRFDCRNMPTAKEVKNIFSDYLG